MGVIFVHLLVEAVSSNFAAITVQGVVSSFVGVIFAHLLVEAAASNFVALGVQGVVSSFIGVIFVHLLLEAAVSNFTALVVLGVVSSFVGIIFVHLFVFTHLLAIAWSTQAVYFSSVNPCVCTRVGELWLTWVYGLLGQTHR